ALRSPGPRTVWRRTDRGPSGTGLGVYWERQPAPIRSAERRGGVPPGLSVPEAGNAGWPGAGDLPGPQGFLTAGSAPLRRGAPAPSAGGGTLPEPRRTASGGTVPGQNVR